MRALIQTLFGTYTPVTYEVFEYDVNGVLRKLYDAIPNGLAGVDWPFILNVVIFIVVLYCVLRIIGAVISRV